MACFGCETGWFVLAADDGIDLWLFMYSEKVHSARKEFNGTARVLVTIHHNLDTSPNPNKGGIQELVSS